MKALLQIYSCFFSHSVKLYAAYRFQQCHCLAAILVKMSMFNSHMQAWCSGVRWRLGQEASLAPPCSNLRFFESKCTVLKKVLVTRPVTRGTRHPWKIPPPLENVLDIVYKFGPLSEKSSPPLVSQAFGTACDVVKTFRPPAVIRRTGNCAPFAPLVTTLHARLPFSDFR